MDRVVPLLRVPKQLLRPPPVYNGFSIGVEPSNEIVVGIVANKMRTTEDVPIKTQTRRESPFIVLIIAPILTGFILLIGLILYVIFNQTLEGIDFLSMFMFGIFGFVIGVLICLMYKCNTSTHHEESN